MLAEASLLVALSVQHGPGAEACLSTPQLERSVERRLKRKVFVDPERAGLRFVVSFSKHADELRARIEVSSIDGTPRGARLLVTSSHCSALDDALALSVALLVDQPPDPEPPSDPPVLPEGAAPAVAKTAPAAPRPIAIPAEVIAPREPWHAFAGLSAAGVWGVVPDVTPGIALHFTLVPRYFLPTTFTGEAFRVARAERDAASGARFRLIRAGIAVCPALLQHPERSVSLCFGQKLGWLLVEGYGFDHDARERRLSYALTAGVEGHQRLFFPFSIRGYLGAEVPVMRDQFASGGRNSTNLFQSGPVGLGAQVGLEAQLW